LDQIFEFHPFQGSFQLVQSGGMAGDKFMIHQSLPHQEMQYGLKKRKLIFLPDKQPRISEIAEARVNGTDGNQPPAVSAAGPAHSGGYDRRALLHKIT
jgi:hypothetical protein